MFKAITIFRIGKSKWIAPTLSSFEETLKKNAFVPCEPSSVESVGWVPPRPQEHSPHVENINGQWVLNLQFEKKAVPSSAVNREVKQRVDKIEADTGIRPGRRAIKQLKEDVAREFLPRAFSKLSNVLVWVNLKEGLLVVGSASVRVADEVLKHLFKVMSTHDAVAPIRLLRTSMSADAAMSSWLLEKEAPAGFTLDRDLELCQPDSNKAAVKYARHNLEIDEVVEHIKNGKLPKQMAMTFDDRISFALCADLTIKKIELLDVIFTDMTKEDTSGFDADVTIITSELLKLIPALVTALGDEVEED